MKLDPADVVGDGCWHVLSRALAFLGCLWLGSFMGIVAVANERIITDPLDIFYGLLLAPLALLNLWFPLTLAVIIGAVFWFKSDKPLNIAAPVLCSVFSFIVCIAAKNDSGGDTLIRWVIWLFLQAMVAAAAWFYTKYHHNKWIQEMAELQIENDQRRAALKETFGTESFDRDIDDINSSSR